MPRLFGESNGMFGKHHSTSTKQKIAKTKKGKNRAISTRTKISLGLIKYYSIPENKNKYMSIKRSKQWAQSKKFKIKQSINALKRWSDPIERTKWINSFNISSKNTNIEILLEKELKNRNIKFKKHIPIFCCIPDIFIEPNICIFADGDHWHGNPVKYKSADHIIGIKFAKDVWKRDRNINKKLIKEKYKVLRFWGSEIEKDVKKVVDKIERACR